MPCRTCQRLFLWLTPWLIFGCHAVQPVISGTDLPHIPRVTLSSSEVTESQGGVPTSGRFEFTGPVYDALERLRWISRDYVEDGWTPAPPEGSQARATQIFTKPFKNKPLKRVVTITALASQTDGTVVVELHSEAVASD